MLIVFGLSFYLLLSVRFLATWMVAFAFRLLFIDQLLNCLLSFLLFDNSLSLNLFCKFMPCRHVFLQKHILSKRNCHFIILLFLLFPFFLNPFSFYLHENNLISPSPHHSSQLPIRNQILIILLFFFVQFFQSR